MEGFCRGCLIKYDDPMELLQYTEKYRRLFVYSTGLQVKRNDTITFQICKDCFLNMKAACKFKKSCRMSDKKLKNFLALKEFEGDVDFSTFLKNSYDSITFRLPLMSGCSTPANHKGRDDDNESTCTSIRNFMTDILEGEEVPDTEARIIREVIEEEADVLDDSLDSHWLQDDASIDTDFRLDFSFSPFATPHSVHNDHCYTPKTCTDQTEEQGQLKKYFTSISPARKNKVVNDFTDIIKNNQSEKELCIYEAEEINHEEPVDKFDMPMIGSAEDNFELPLINDGQSCNNLDIPSIDSERLINNLDLPMIDNEKSISNSDLPMIDNDKSTNNLDLSMIDNNKTTDNLEPPVIDHDKPNSNLDIPNLDSERLINNLDLSINNNEISMNNLDISSFDSEKSIDNLIDIDNERSITNFDVPIIENANKNQATNAKHFYMSNDNTDYITTSKEIERIVDGKVIQRKEKDKPCIIDQNLEKALEDENNKEFSLDDLLVTPKVIPDASTASTPTITNILFGEQLELNDSSTDNSKKYMEKIDNIEIFEEFFQSSTKDSVKEENIDETKDYFKVPMDVDEVDIGIKEISKNEKMFVYDENQCDLDNFFCNLCNKKFGSSKALSIHFMKKHNIKIIKKKNKYLYDKHRLCNICGKEYKDSRSFHGHMKKHKLALQKESSIFKCELCTLEFSSQSKLNKHIAAHNGTSTIKEPGKFICTVCGAASTSISNLRHHQKRHTMNYMHKCEHCGKGFYRKSDLTVHERLHTGEKPYQCSFCDRLFSRKDSLTKHMKHHIGNRPFECEHCKVTYTTKSQLNVHLRMSVKCRKLRGLLDDKETIGTDLVKPEDKDKTSETNTQSVVNDIKAKSQLPYIDTEMSN